MSWVVKPYRPGGAAPLVRTGREARAARDAFVTFLKVGAAATVVALILGTLASLAVARLRGSSASLDEASADLGADPSQTFRYVTLPTMRTALAAAALLAFALSFDEIIVTRFTIGAGQETLPIWIFHNLFRPNEIPIVNVVAVIVVLLSIIRSTWRTASPARKRASPAGGRRDPSSPRLPRRLSLAGRDPRGEPSAARLAAFPGRWPT
jgi:ABC-type spermidine/putrescine transport system permease subunit II